MGFSRQEYWNGLPFPPPQDLLNPGIESVSLMSPELAGGFFTASTTWEALHMHTSFKKAFWCAKIVANTHTHTHASKIKLGKSERGQRVISLSISPFCKMSLLGETVKVAALCIISYNCMWICNYPNETSIKRKTIAWSWNPWVGSISC